MFKIKSPSIYELERTLAEGAVQVDIGLCDRIFLDLSHIDIDRPSVELLILGRKHVFFIDLPYKISSYPAKFGVATADPRPAKPILRIEMESLLLLGPYQNISSTFWT
jgi:hypothetical protein